MLSAVPRFPVFIPAEFLYSHLRLDSFVDAWYEKGSTYGLNIFKKTRLLYPEIVGIMFVFFNMNLFVYLSHGNVLSAST